MITDITIDLDLCSLVRADLSDTECWELLDILWDELETRKQSDEDWQAFLDEHRLERMK